MARIRYLKPDFFLDEDLSEQPFENRLGYQGLWCYADREGRLEDSPKRLKAQIFPYDDIDMEKVLKELSKKPFIKRYLVDGRKYLQIINFNKHQKPHHTEQNSIIPPCSNGDKPLDNGSATVQTQEGMEKGMEKIKIKGMEKNTTIPANNAGNPIVDQTSKKQKETILNWQDMIDHFDKTWSEFKLKKTGNIVRYPWPGQQDKSGQKIWGSIASRTKLYSPFGMMALWDLYLQMNDDWVRSTGFSVEAFLHKIPVLVDDARWKGLASKYESKFMKPVNSVGEILKDMGFLEKDKKEGESLRHL
jgi:hypothetical protein